jgi:hypothetical protein
LFITDSGIKVSCKAVAKIVLVKNQEMKKEEQAILLSDGEHAAPSEPLFLSLPFL